MDIFQDYFHVISAFNSVLLAGLLWSGKRQNVASHVLAIWCLGLSYYLIFPLVLSAVTSAYAMYAFIWGAYFPACFGALLFLYIRTSIARRSVRLPDAIHFLPLLLCIILNLDILTYSNEDIVLLLKQGASQDIQHKLTLVIVYSQALFYLIISGFLLVKFKHQACNHLSNFNPLIFRHLLIVLVLNSVIWLLELSLRFLGNVGAMSFTSDLLFVVFILALSLFHWHNPQRFQIDAISTVSRNEEGDNEDNRGDLSASTRRLLLNEINQLMDIQRPYLNGNITLSSLADMLDMSTHHVSETLNREANKNFYQFINEHRVKHFCELLKMAPKEKRILDLAMDSGFSSKSTFNLVFKQTLGITPSQFKAQLKENGE